MSGAFEHSIKVPRLYKTAAKIVKTVREDGASLTQLVYLKQHPNIKAVYALALTSLRQGSQLDQLIRRTKILFNEPRLDAWLTRVLITELLWGKGRLSSECKPVRTVLSYEKILKEELKNVVEFESESNKLKKREDRYNNREQQNIVHREEKSDNGGTMSEEKGEYMRQVRVLGLLLLYSGAMFTLPFAAFFGTQHIMKSEFHTDRFVTSCISVLAAVVTVNLIIASYAYRAFFEPDHLQNDNYSKSDERTRAEADRARTIDDLNVKED